MEHSPFVSIIVPVCNSERTIGECLDALLCQEYPRDKYEIIVVDNGSEDNTPGIIKKYSVALESENEKRSAYAARNKGLERARADIIAFVDGDCVAAKNWLKTAVAEFMKDSRVGCVGGEIINVGENNTLTGKYAQFVNYHNPSIMMNHPFMPYAQTANALYRKEVFEKIGFFKDDDTMYSGGDADICWRMQLETDFKLKYCREAVVYHKDVMSWRGFMRKFFRFFLLLLCSECRVGQWGGLANVLFQ